MTIWRLLLTEIRDILGNPAISLTVIGGMLFYAFLYPQPYLNQVPRGQKIAVLDNDDSPMSRRLIRMVGATAQVDVVSQATSLEDAKRLLERSAVSGVLRVPENFYRDILLHRSPTLVYAGDASYFLVYGTIIKGITAAANALDEEIRLVQDSLAGQGGPVPLALNLQPVFNPNTGYLNYVIPAVFLLVLHQTLVIAAGIHATTRKAQRIAGVTVYGGQVSILAELCLRLAAFMVIYLPFTLFYYGWCFETYQIYRLADPGELFHVIVPFLLAAAALGTLIGKLIPRKELVTLTVLVSSIPLLFTAGFIWPKSAIPRWINGLVQWVPFTHAANVAQQLNQMGADFLACTREFGLLWGLFAVYFMGSILLYQQNRQRGAGRVNTNPH
ncbi:MAG: ABC transporter [Deltaproteobacteria bacterium]|nr:MAG: ABC transporter [Deltaproteobacteria bacterium]